MILVQMANVLIAVTAKPVPAGSEMSLNSSELADQPHLTSLLCGAAKP